MPNQYSQTVRKQLSSWFWGDNFGPKSQNLRDPYIHSTTVLYDIKLVLWGDILGQEIRNLHDPYI